MNSDLLIFKDKHEDMLDKFFNPDDIRDIRLIRKKYEEDINKTNDKKVFFSYIKYEIYLWKTIIGKPRNIHYHRSFAKMIINLHKVALKYHKDDLSLWLSYLKFCMEADFSSLISDIFVQILCYHTDEHLWLLASKWELDEHNNIERALAYLNRALFYHPQSTSIYCEIFRLELLENNDASNIELVEKKVIKLIDSMENKIPKNVDLYISLFKIASKHIKLQNNIIEKMLKHFSSEEKLWEILANRELEGHHISKEIQYSFIQNHLLDFRLKNHIKKYKYAVNLINTETIWTKYLNSLAELQEDEKYNNHYLKETFMDDCLKAHKKRLLSEDIYIKWIECLQDEINSDMLQILEEATADKPKCLQLWVARIRYHMKNNSEKSTIENIFTEAIKILGDNSTHIWLLKIQYYQLNLKCDPSFVESVYRSALSDSPEIARLIKPQFLDWLVLFKSSKAAYEEYKKLVTEKPWCLEIHKKMVELEAMCPQPDKSTLENISKIAIEQFGKNTWLEYIHEEISCGPQWKRDVFTKYLLNL